MKGNSSKECGRGAPEFVERVKPDERRGSVESSLFITEIAAYSRAVADAGSRNEFKAMNNSNKE
jgi:hypothetical protein